MTGLKSENHASAEGGPSLALRPIHGARSERWTLQLDEDILALSTGDGRLVLMLPREESPRHLRFDLYLARGRLLSILVTEGSKAYRFKCSGRDLRRLVDWLPQKSREELEKDVRWYGVAMVLVGVLQLALPQYFHWWLGLAFALQGLLVVVVPKRPMYLLNFGLMLAAGLVLLFMPKSTPPVLAAAIDVARVLCTGLGSLLLIWCVQQLSLLGANHRLRAARIRRDLMELEDENLPSPVLNKIFWVVTTLAALLVGQVAGLFLQAWLGEEPPLPRDWILAITLAVLTIGVAAVLWARPSQAYVEAKIAGQFAVVLAGLYGAGVLSIDISGNLPFPPELLWNGLFALGTPYVWGPIIVFVVLFNWWFSRAVERELGQADE